MWRSDPERSLVRVPSAELERALLRNVLRIRRTPHVSPKLELGPGQNAVKDDVLSKDLTAHTGELR